MSARRGRNIPGSQTSMTKGPVASVSMVSTKDWSKASGLEPGDKQEPGYT